MKKPLKACNEPGCPQLTREGYSHPTQEKHRVFIAGWSREQSDEVYQAILEQFHHALILQGKYSSANGKVKKHNTNSIIQPLSR
ncbi:hypothetical protein ABEX00_16510 [Bacillus safensis]